MNPSVEIPDKLYFKIGDVAKILGVEAYVLRYWETEFPEIRPSKSRTGQRLYRKTDVEKILHIKDLLYGQKFTIDGARRRLRGEVIEHRQADDQRQPALNFDDGETALSLKKMRDVVSRVVGEMDDFTARR